MARVHIFVQLEYMGELWDMKKGLIRSVCARLFAAIMA